MLSNRIMILNDNEKNELENEIKEFVKEFTSNSQSLTKNDFENLLVSKKVTLSILCKLSEWCNTGTPKYEKGKQHAIRISNIIFGQPIPKLDRYEISIENNTIRIFK